jgi:predicted nucleotidyltransferase
MTPVLDEIIATLSALPQVEAISLSGSRAASASDESSDYDINVFSSEPIPADIRRDLALHHDPAPEIANQWWGESDYWTDGEASYDIMLWDVEWYEGNLRAVIEDHRPSNGYTTAFWFSAVYMQPLFDRRGWLARLQELAATPYPDALAEAIIAYNHPLLRGIHTSYAAQIARAIALDDPVSVNHRVAELLKTVFDIVFAHHRVLHPGEKRQLRTLATLPETQALDGHIRELLIAAGNPAYEGISDAVSAVCDEVDSMLDNPAS